MQYTDRLKLSKDELRLVFHDMPDKDKLIGVSLELKALMK